MFLYAVATTDRWREREAVRRERVPAGQVSMRWPIQRAWCLLRHSSQRCRSRTKAHRFMALLEARHHARTLARLRREVASCGKSALRPCGLLYL